MNSKINGAKAALIVKTPKYVLEVVRDFGKKKPAKLRFEAMLTMRQEYEPHLRFLVTGIPVAPASWTATFIADGNRIRGIDYSATEKTYMHKVRIPAGWHENVIDWAIDVKERDHNRHIPMPDGFAPSDLHDFRHKTAEYWNIKIDRSELL